MSPVVVWGGREGGRKSIDWRFEPPPPPPPVSVVPGPGEQQRKGQRGLEMVQLSQQNFRNVSKLENISMKVLETRQNPNNCNIRYYLYQTFKVSQNIHIEKFKIALESL